MQEIKCPKCGEVFTVDEAGYAAILKQVRDREFQAELAGREKNAAELARAKAAAELQHLAAEKDAAIAALQARLTAKEAEAQLAVHQAAADRDRALAAGREEIARLTGQLESGKKESLLREQSIKEGYEAQLKAKEEQIAYYKDMKAKLSTKMVGETLEQHCETEFNRLRATGFTHAYFEKDNDARDGTKGDFIYRDYAEDGTEYISVMFEMKNEMDETKTKHKNEDFFKKLDEDRTKKGCEYAVLVSLLEPDSELYNAGIVDVSYRYPKMYVIRPQFFIPLITLLRNAALNSVEYQRQLTRVREQNVDITRFEDDLADFKDKFSRSVRLAGQNFQKAIEEIDKTIDHLQKTKEALRLTGTQLTQANSKAEDLTIKRLTRSNPTMAAKFAELEKAPEKE